MKDGQVEGSGIPPKQELSMQCTEKQDGL